MIGLAALALAAAHPHPAADVSPNHLAALQGGYHYIQSEATGRPYHIYVRLPEGYDSDQATRYPTIYLLDGDVTFPMLAPAHLFLTYESDIPEAIVVGIAYGTFGAGNSRSLDFTTTAWDENPEGGQAPSFQRFLQDELVPLVEREYAADPARRIILGNSRGANYVLYSAFSDPDFFWARIASNPSTHPDGDKWLAQPPAATREDLHLVMTSATRDRPDLRGYARQWMAHWVGRDGAPWQVHAIDIHDATHAADIPRAYRAAMEAVFADDGHRAKTSQDADH